MATKNEGPMALARGFALLRLLATRPNGLNLSSIAAQLDVPKSSLAGTLKGLSDQGLIRRQGALYLLGEEALSLASMIMSGRSLRQIARPHLEKAMQECGETVLLAEMGSGQTAFAYIDFVETSKTIRFCAHIGEQRPLYPTACGRLFLAFMPDAERDAYFRKVKMAAVTDRTIVDRDKLEELLETIRQDGISVTMGDFSSDAAGFATPIRDASGAVCGGLVIGAPIARGKAENTRFRRIAKETAADISSVLGYVPEQDRAEPKGARPARKRASQGTGTTG
ncbi:IclR family transcriptional regulator [Futiania mangrovi]|uniref:IclR family transcriptional regulator n=1 Tax=Futiania mangrovi TaxID=2959716 RepID=A0A9J6P9E4_9PROT|nr:IclR family transcriptional regulator [Futiania mangrovii]MCP1335461.1 IclR family transcriptional regulator [Futiania mangrovii]